MPRKKTRQMLRQLFVYKRHAVLASAAPLLARARWRLLALRGAMRALMALQAMLSHARVAQDARDEAPRTIPPL